MSPDPYKSQAARERAAQSRSRTTAARNRALQRLRDAHRAEYDEYYAQELHLLDERGRS